MFLGRRSTCSAYVASTIRNEDTRDQFLVSLSKYYKLLLYDIKIAGFTGFSQTKNRLRLVLEISLGNYYKLSLYDLTIAG
jgi:hypothetical protein